MESVQSTVSYVFPSGIWNVMDISSTSSVFQVLESCSMIRNLFLGFYLVVFMCCVYIDLQKSGPTLKQATPGGSAALEPCISYGSCSCDPSSACLWQHLRSSGRGVFMSLRAAYWFNPAPPTPPPTYVERPKIKVQMNDECRLAFGYFLANRCRAEFGWFLSDTCEGRLFQRQEVKIVPVSRDDNWFQWELLLWWLCQRLMKDAAWEFFKGLILDRCAYHFSI